MTSHLSDHDDDLAVVDMQEAMEAFVLDDDVARRQYLRTRWIEQVMLQLVERRVSRGLTQRDLGERMGKPQSSIARLERGDDLKLSTFWDYLAATGSVPAGRIPVTDLAAREDELSRYVPGTGDTSPVLRVQHWRKAPLAAGDVHTGSDNTGIPVRETPLAETDAVVDEDEKVAVA